MPEPQKSRWVFWVLGGCLLIVGLGIAGIVGVYYWGKSKLTTLVEEQTDPMARERNAKAMLGAQTLPPGYHAGVSFSIGLAKTVRLSDNPVTANEPTFRDRGFVFNDSISAEKNDLDDFLSGTKGNLLDKMGVRLRSDEKLGDGTLSVNGQELHYYAHRGEVTLDEEVIPSLVSVITIGCPDKRDRWAIWFQRVEPGTPTADVPRVGSVVAPEAIQDLFGHFRICQ